ncbi:hypothetical protein VTL71DRAFT_9832 [Oculimacula yallundae]|uniref:Uncharacterized protein n=1 Tax=Oculimacula yallundae TaxID=86028 RepID=A0ABR4BQM5_9HELO
MNSEHLLLPAQVAPIVDAAPHFPSGLIGTVTSHVPKAFWQTTGAQKDEVHPHCPDVEQQFPKALPAQVAFCGEEGPHNPSKLTGDMGVGTLVLDDLVDEDSMEVEVLVLVLGSTPLYTSIRPVPPQLWAELPAQGILQSVEFASSFPT